MLKFSRQFLCPKVLLPAETNVPAVHLPLVRYFSQQLTTPSQVFWCSGSWLMMVPLLDFVWIGGRGMPPLVLPSRCFPHIAPNWRSPFWSSPRITGTWSFAGSFLPKSGMIGLAASFPMLSENADFVVWPHSSSGHFSIQSLYGCLIRGQRSSKFKEI